MSQDALLSDSFFIPDLCRREAVGVLVLVAELLAVMLVLARDGFIEETWTDLGTTSLFVQLVTLSAAGLLCVSRERLARLPRQAGAGVAYVIILGAAMVWSIAAGWLSNVVLNPGIPETMPTIAAITANVLIAAIIGGLIMRYFYVQEQLRLQQAAALHAQIQALQSRIRPHFLFNSMNIIASLIETDPRTAESVVEDLSDLFRASLRDASNVVTLAHELDLCRRYMRIEQLRIGSRLKVDWQLEGVPLNDIMIPLLSLQPLLENAVYHGVQPLVEGGTVTVAVTCTDGEVRIRVENPVPAGDNPAAHRGNNMAIDNIRRRLTALYGPSSGLDALRSGNSYSTTLHYPFNIGQQGR